MSTVDWVVLIITIGALGIGLISMAIGKVVAWYDRVKRSGVRHSTVTSSRRAWKGGSEPERPASRAGSSGAERPHENQENRAPVRSIEDAIAILAEHNFAGDERLIDVLAVLQRDGEPIISANKIRDHVGGTDAAVKARVASHRPKVTPKSSPRLERPANGW